MNRLLAALALAAGLVLGPILAQDAPHAKANLTTVSNMTSAPAVVAPVGQALPKSSTFILVREAPARASRTAPPKPRVIRDVLIEEQRAAEAKKAAERKAAQAREAARKAAAKKSAKTKKVTTTKSTTVKATIRGASGPTSSRNWATPGQCTWGVQLKWKAATGSYIGGFYGNAMDWGWKARNAGHSVGYTPRVRSVVVLQPGVHGSSSVGHVAWVTGVSGNKITVVEMNALAGPYNWNTRTMTHTGGMSYIYAP